MAKSVEEVRVGVDGVVAVGAFGAAAPTSAVSPLTAHVDLGYVSEDGVTETTEQSSEPLRAWQKAKIVRTIVTEGTVTYKCVLIQTSAETVGLYYGGTVLADGSIVVDASKVRPIKSFVLDVIDGDAIIRAYAPEAQVTEIGDQVYANGEPIGYEVTITANYNEALGGSVKKWYSSLTGVAPTLTSILPSGAAAGSIVKAIGTGFTSAMTVTVGGTAATVDVNDPTEAYITLPAGSAGSVNVVATTTGGSTTRAYTRA